MKKIITAISLCVLLTNAFAQKNFNVIEFSKFLTTSGSPGMLDYGVFAKKDAAKNLKVIETIKSGTLNINVIDSTITVKTDDNVDKVFKIKTINEEEKNKYKTKTLRIGCQDKMKNAYDLIIERDENFKKINQMHVTIAAANNDGDKYTCTYLKDLFQK